MSLYLVVCLAIAAVVVIAALKKGAIAWVIAGAVALSMLAGVPAVSGPFTQLTQGVARVITETISGLG
ncbi:hypothetical protein SAMN06265360_12639 [Haloechinothrix alba]|uniref:Uncharacterized protein n=1 Tax=Haloechinothrix alba TaxID=664784 RepID=A0A238ZVX3_9PSEU|nr:hypothetical protein [Haloechinothrix alba]SNR87515.1 hypothetical protein SAMN06265360_12639 [Haloechinothrix alba]